MQQMWSSDLKWDLSLNAASQLGENDLLRGVTAVQAATKNKRGWSPAMYASAAGHRQALVLLLSDPQHQLHRDDVEDRARDEAREQAMMTAVQYENFDVVAFLVEKGLVTLSASSTLNDEFYDTACLMQIPTTNMDCKTTNLVTCHTTGELINLIKLREFFAACVSHPHWESPSNSVAICSNLFEHGQANRLVSRELQLFCRSLVVRINNYCPNEALHHFLHSLELSELKSNFLREEVDFTILIGMDDQDLLQIGINSPDAREKILEAKANITVYFKQLFGSKMTSFKRLL